MAPDASPRLITAFVVESAPEWGMWRVRIRIGSRATSEYFMTFKRAVKYVRTFTKEMDGEE